MSIYLNFGNGADGDVTISSTFNANTTASPGRTYPDAVNYAVTNVGSNSVQTSATPNGIVIGDEVLLITLRGTVSNLTNVGNYETFRVQNVSGSTITFTTSKTKLYGQNGGDVVGSMKIMIQRIPNYNNLTLSNSTSYYQAAAWDGTKNGVTCFRVKDTLENHGLIRASSAGFRGAPPPIGTPAGYGHHGESITDDYIVTATAVNWDVTHEQGGGGGATFSNYASGGGYGTAGVKGPGASEAGTTYGVNTLTKLYLGSGGGGSPRELGYSPYPGGGSGGGIVFVSAAYFKNYGGLRSNGTPGPDGYSTWDAGGGSGGSILIHIGTIYSYAADNQAAGGAGLQGNNGGAGRYAIYYKFLGNDLGTNTPTPYTSTDVILPYKISGILSDPADIYLFKDSDGSYQEKKTVTEAGTYEFTVAADTEYMLVAKPENNNLEPAVYTRVRPVLN